MPKPKNIVGARVVEIKDDVLVFEKGNDLIFTRMPKKVVAIETTDGVQEGFVRDNLINHGIRELTRAEKEA